MKNGTKGKLGNEIKKTKTGNGNMNTSYQNIRLKKNNKKWKMETWKMKYIITNKKKIKNENSTKWNKHKLNKWKMEKWKMGNGK